MKDLAELLRNTKDYIDWVRHMAGGGAKTSSAFAEENTRRLIAEVLGYDGPGETISVKMTDSPPAETDATVKFLAISGEFSLPIDPENLERAARSTLAYGANLFIYTNGPHIKVISVDTEEGELETMMEFNLLGDDLTEIATSIWPLSKKDCGKKVLIATQDDNRIAQGSLINQAAIK